MSSDEHVHAANSFEAANGKVSVLVTSFHTGAVNTNVIKPPASSSWSLRIINAGLQGMERVHCLGRRFPQLVWILSHVASFDAHVEANNIEKALPQVPADLEPILLVAGLHVKETGANGGEIIRRLLHCCFEFIGRNFKYRELRPR